MIPYDLDIGTFDQQRPLYELILTALAGLTDLDPMTIATLPVGAVLIPLVAYAAFQPLVRDRVTTFMIAGSLLVSHPLASVQLGTFVYVWAHLLLFAYMYVIWRIVVAGRSTLRVAIAIALFFVTEFLYPTTATWMMVIAAVTGPALVLLDRASHNAARRGGILTAAAAAMLLYLLYFDRVFATNVLPSLGRSGIESQLLSTLNELTRQVGAGLSSAFLNERLPYQASNLSSPVAAPVVIAQYVLLAIAMISGLVAVGSFLRRRIADHERFSRAVCAAIFIVGAIAHTLAYALYGHFSLRAIVLIGPLIGVLLLRAGWTRVRPVRMWTALYATVSLIGMIGYFIAYAGSPQQAELRPVAHWLLSRDDVPVVSGDLGLYGRILIIAADQGRVVELASLDDCAFDELVTNARCERLPADTLFIFDRRRLEAPIQSIGWQQFGPPADYWTQIIANRALRLEYEDEAVLLFSRGNPP